MLIIFALNKYVNKNINQNSNKHWKFWIELKFSALEMDVKLYQIISWFKYLASDKYLCYRQFSSWHCERE